MAFPSAAGHDTNIPSLESQRRRALKILLHGNLESDAYEILLQEIQEGIKDSNFDELEIEIYLNFHEGQKLDSKKMNVLLLQEPKSVLPWQYQSKVLSQFDVVIPFGPWRAHALGIAHWVFMPYRFPLQAEAQNVNREIWLSMINAGKFSSSVNSNYGLRRVVCKKLVKEEIDFRLFGWDWNTSYVTELRKRYIALRASFLAKEKISWRETFSTLFHHFKAYQGGIKTKSQILQNSELTLVIENESDYVTEKIFDAFNYQTVPIYVGPDLGTLLPEIEQCLLRCEPNAESIIQRIKQTSTEEILEKRAAIQLLMRDDELKAIFDFGNVWRKVGKIVLKSLKETYLK